MSNVVYRTSSIAEYFACHRIAWGQFYPSERNVIGQLGLGPTTSVLDVGCGCAGLGLALRDEFGVTEYTGVEINAEAAAMAQQIHPNALVLEGDILTLAKGLLASQAFDVVFSLSCIDWNVEFTRMLRVCWAHVEPGGWFVATFRLTGAAGCADMAHSYQHINYEGKRQGELAAYVVLNAGELGEHIGALRPGEVLANGYWGPPSPSAVTPYDRLCFTALALRKRRSSDTAPTRCQLDLPAEIREQLELQEH